MKSRRNLITVVSILVGIMVLVLSYTSYHYLKHRSAIEQDNGKVIVNERKDFEYLSRKTEDELKEIGFSSDDMEILYEMNEEQVTLNPLLEVVFDEPGSVETVDMYEHKRIEEGE